MPNLDFRAIIPEVFPREGGANAGAWTLKHSSIHSFTQEIFTITMHKALLMVWGLKCGQKKESQRLHESYTLMEETSKKQGACYDQSSRQEMTAA